MTENISFNFGAIRDTITRLSASELIREQKSKTLDTFLAEVNKSPILTKQYYVFKNIENSKPFEKERLAERFIAQNLKLFKNEKWENIVSENKKIRRELLDDMHIQSKIDNKLSESINTLIEFNTNTVYSQDVERENDAYEYVLKYLTREVKEDEYSLEKKDNPSLIKNGWKFITQTAVSNFNERYQHLNEEEKKVFSILVSDEKKKKVYLETLEEANLNQINYILETKKDLDKESIEVLESFKEKINSVKNVNFINLDEHIISNIELSNLIK